MIKTSCFDEISKSNKGIWCRNKIGVLHMIAVRQTRNDMFDVHATTARNILKHIEHNLLMKTGYLLQILPYIDQIDGMASQHELGFQIYHSRAYLSAVFVFLPQNRIIFRTIVYHKGTSTRVTHNTFDEKIEYEQISKILNYKQIVKVLENMNPTDVKLWPATNLGIL